MHLKNLIITGILLWLAACSRGGVPPVNTPSEEIAATPIPSALLQEAATPTPTPPPPRLLTICLVREPRSLFLYDAVSTSEQNVLAAIYDGPIDIKNFTPQPVLLDGMPSLSDGGAALQAVEVNGGEPIVDAFGNLNNLTEGIVYLPSGCGEQACALSYSGADPVRMDQLVVRFTLLPDLQWSDGAPLTAGDSVYSYEVLRSLYASALPARVSRTASYTALDDRRVEWVGLPGFVDGLYQAKFFSPLPQHAWADIPVADLPNAEASSRKPLGWGAYVIDEWVAGDHITLHANPLYFRANIGLPFFNNLVYRFLSDSSEAQAAITAGECDLVDQIDGFESATSSLLSQRDAGRISIALQAASAWEVLEFDIAPLDEERIAFFTDRDVRQAVAMCIDRQALVDQLSGGQMQVADAFVPAVHPLFNPQAKQYAVDMPAAVDLLTASGWLDTDADPLTPRIAQGINGISDGTPFLVQYLVSDDSDSRAAAQMIQADLRRCGIWVEIVARQAEEYLAPGPDGPVFGRQFDLAQFAWMAAVEPPCSLYLTSEIPAEYPASAKGWGGVNASGYSNPLYDQACLEALYSLPDAPAHTEKHAEAQAIFAEDLPALPLYWHYRVVLGRPDMCSLPVEAVADNIFTDLELFNYGETCP